MSATFLAPDISSSLLAGCEAPIAPRNASRDGVFFYYLQRFGMQYPVCGTAIGSEFPRLGRNSGRRPVAPLPRRELRQSSLIMRRVFESLIELI
jgi:hypothetical protein